MVGANAQMGVLRLEANGFLVANPWSDLCLARGFSVSRKPIFGFALKLRPGDGIQGLSIWRPRSGVTTVLASGGAGARSTAEGLLEKELKFSPTFGDYVKVLESVRTDRSKHLGSKTDGSSSNHSSAEKDGFGKAREKGDQKWVEPRESCLNSGVHGDGKLKEQFRHKRGDKYSRDEQDQKLDCSNLARDTTEKNRAWRNGGKGRGKDRNLRNVSKDGLSNIIEGVQSINLDKRRVKYFDGLSERETAPKQNGKHGRNGQRYDRFQGKMGALQNNGKLFGGTDLFGTRFQGKTSEVGNSKGLSKKGSSFKGNFEHTLAESEFSRTESGKAYQIEIGRKVDKSGIHESPLGRDDYAGRGRQSGKERCMGSCQSSVPDIDSGKLQQNMHLNDTEIDATDHCGHSPQWKAFGNSKENNEGSKYQGRIVAIHGDDIITKKFGSKVSKIDEKLCRTDSRVHKGAGKLADDADLDDRAAFKTFEVFTDVKNRPRVLRMELEERIQNLAKRLHATDVNMPEWKFSRMIHNAKIKFTDHSILRVVQILGAFGNWRRTLQVIEWLQSRERFKSYKSRYIYTTVLSVLGKAKRPLEALNVFYAMSQELSSYPDLAAYHCIAVILGQAGLMKELFDVIDCMRAIPEKKFKLGMLQKWNPQLEPDLVVYNAVLNGCIQQKQWEGAFWVLQELKQKGIQPSSTTYGLVMEVMLVCGKYNLVHEFFLKAQKNSIPGALNYKVLVNTFWREGKIDEAVVTVKDMERRGIVGSASLYYDLARCLCSAGRCQEALVQINKLCKVAQKPLVVTYTGLIQTCLDSGSIENAAFIFNRMHAFCSPNIVTCNIMLKSYVEHGMFQEAKYLFQTILEGNKGINKKSDIRGKAIPDKFTFNTMMEACVDTKHWDDFEFAYQQMLHYGYYFDAKRHLRMVMEASRAGKVQLLETTCQHLLRSGRTLPPAIVKERFCLRLQNGDCAAALSCLDLDEPGKLQAYSEKSWISTLDTNLARLGDAVLIRLAHEINALPSQSHQRSPVLQNLLNACKKIVSLCVDAIDLPDDQQSLSCST